jgi:hypothetical protein
VAALSAIVQAPAWGQAVVSWALPVSDSWTSTTAWSNAPVFPNNDTPDAGDFYSAIIGASGGPYTVSLNSDITISNLTLSSADATLQQTGGTLRLVDGGGTISAGDYVLAGGTLSSDDSILIASRFDWTDGALSGFGSVDVAPSASINLGAGGIARTLSRQMNNSGVVNFTDGSLILSNGTLNNQAGGVLNISGSARFSSGAGFNNLVRNSGQINISNGMNWTAPLLNSGTINVAGGGSLIFDGGSFSHQAGATITGAGFVELGGSSTSYQNVDGTLTLAGSNINFSAGTIGGAGNIDVSGVFTWNEGTIGTSVNNSGSINPSATLNVLPGAMLNVAGSTTHSLYRNLNNSGTITLGLGAKVACYGSLNNLANGVINLTGNATDIFGDDDGWLNNSGTINVDPSGGSSTIEVINSGTINVASGSLTALGTFLDGSRFSGAGMILAGGTLNGTVNSTVANLAIHGGSIPPGGLLFSSIVGNGTLNLNAGTMSMGISTFSASGGLNIAPGATLLANSVQSIVSTTINNQGTMSPVFLRNGTINNGATGVLTGFPTASTIGTLNLVRNSGTIAVNLTTLGTATFNVPTINSGSIIVTETGLSSLATINFSGGSFTQNTGAYISSNSVALDLGADSTTTQTFAGNVTIAGNFVEMTHGFITGPGNMNVIGGFGLGNGTINGTGNINISSTGFFSDLGAGTVSRNITSSGTIFLGSSILNFASATLNSSGTMTSGSLNVSNGTLNNSGTMLMGIASNAFGILAISNGTFNNSGTMLLGTGGNSRGTVSLSNGTFNNSGTILLGTTTSFGGTINLNNGTFNNLPSGNLLFNGGSISFGAGTNLLANSGTMTLSPGTFSTISLPSLVDSGTILIQNGTLNFNTGSPVIGTYNNGAFIGGAGTIDFSGTQVVTGTMTLAGLHTRFALGTISNSGALTVTGSLNWTGGAIVGPGTTTIAAGASISVVGSGTLTSTLNNLGVMTFASGAPSLSTSTILNGASGVMNINANFSSNVLTATLQNSGTINLNSGVSAATFGGLFTNSGTINVNIAATGVATFGLFNGSQITDSGTIIAQSGTLQIATTVFNNGAYLTGPGTIDFNSVVQSALSPIVVNGTLTLAGSNVRLNNGSITGAGNIDVLGTFNWVGGQIAGTGTMSILPSATMNVQSGTLSRNLNNSGSISFAGGNLSLDNGTINNLAGGVINISSGLISGNGPTFAVRNLGLINIDPSGGALSFSATLFNSSSINLASGTLNFRGINEWTGSTTFSNNGFVELGASSLSMNSVDGTLNLSGGSFALSNGTITGGGDLKINAAFAWNGGWLGAASMDVGAGATMTIPSTATTNFLGGSLNNLGEIDLNGTIQIANGFANNVQGGVFNNLPGGIVNISHTSPFTFADVEDIGVVNAGIFNLNPSGSGSITISNGWTNSGTINVAGGTVVFGTGSPDFHELAGAVITGPGLINLGTSLQMLDGTTTFAGSNMLLNGGTIAGDGNLNLSGNLDWEGGVISGNGSVAVGATGVLSVGSSGVSRTLSRVVNNSGAINLLGSLTLGNGTINNLASGVMTANAAGTIGINPGIGTVNRIVNAGAMSVTAGTLQVNVPFSNTGTVDVSSGASLQLLSSISQVIGSTLTHGTWAVHGAATLGMGSASVTNNSANVILDGVGSSMPAINPLASNGGMFQVIGGRSFSTVGNYTNSGRTVLGLNSAVDITGALNNTGTVDVGGVVVVGDSVTTPLSTIAAQVTSGFAGGSWNGIGIDSSPAVAVAADNTNGHKTGVGYALASSLGIVGMGTFAGQAVTDSSIVVRYTYLGDSNLDQTVNLLDLNSIATNFGQSGKMWVDGDANYDGQVNILDFNAVAENFGMSGVGSSPPAPPAEAGSPGLGAIVPEPGMIEAAWGLLLVLRRRKRRILCVR